MRDRANKGQEILEGAITGLPKVARAIAAVPPEDRVIALTAAENSYYRTAIDLGYTEGQAAVWAAIVAARLQAEVKKVTRWAEREQNGGR